MYIENKTTQDTVTKLATSQPPQPKQQQQNGTAVCKPLTWSFLSMSMKWSRVFSWADISGSNVPTLMKRSTPQLFRALVAHITEETRLETDTCIYIYIHSISLCNSIHICVARDNCYWKEGTWSDITDSMSSFYGNSQICNPKTVLESTQMQYCTFLSCQEWSWLLLV